MINKFPHIKRKLPALILVTFFILISLINLAQNKLFPPGEDKKLLNLLLQNPDISSLHERLGQYYLGVDAGKAEREYLLAQEYYLPATIPQNTQVLGSQSSPWQIWLNLKTQKGNLVRDTGYWEKVAGAYPDYLYAYLKLAVLDLQSGNPQKAQNYLDIILRKDPTNQEAIKLLGYLLN